MFRKDLMNMQVISASKKAEGVKDAPSNITVITAKQIKEWGMRDLKDVMRRIAGYYVVADRDEWVFAARGNVASELMDQVDVIWLKQFGRMNFTGTLFWQKLTGFIIILADQSQFVSAGDYESMGTEVVS